MVGVSPNYVATAYVQLAPPISQPSAPGTQSLDQRNPWIALGHVQPRQRCHPHRSAGGVVESLKASGYSESFTATLNSSSPLVTFEVTGSSPKQAIDTTNELIQRFTTSVRDLQVDTYGVSTNDLVVARRIDSGTNVAESDGRVKRALVAVAGLGLLLTLAFTCRDRRSTGPRARRSAGLPPGVGMADLSPPPPRSRRRQRRGPRRRS